MAPPAPQAVELAEAPASGGDAPRRHSARLRFPRISESSYLVAILAVALGLRVARLGAADLSTDEIQSLHAIQLETGGLVAERLAAGHSPLYFLLLKGWCSVFGTSQFAMRLPSALTGVALLFPARALVRRLAGEPAALWSMALLAVHPLFVDLAREARMYPLLGLAALVVASRAAAALDGERPGASFWTAAALGSLLHATWALAMVPLAIWLLVELRRAPPQVRRNSKAALIGIAASLAFLAVTLWLAEPQTQELTRRPWLREIGVFVLRIFAGSDLYLFRRVALCAGFGFLWAVALAYGLHRSTPRAQRFALAWGLGVPLASVAAGVLGHVPCGPARYVHLAAVGFIVLAAQAARSGVRWSIACTVCLVLVLTTVSLGRTFLTWQHWSTAASALRLAPDHVVVDDEASRIVLAHYLGREVHVGGPPPGTSAWRHASLVVRNGLRVVEIEPGSELR